MGFEKRKKKKKKFISIVTVRRGFHTLLHTYNIIIYYAHLCAIIIICIDRSNTLQWI